MSVSQAWFGAVAVNSCRVRPLSSTRASRSSWTGGPGLPALPLRRWWEAKTPAIECQRQANLDPLSASADSSQRRNTERRWRLRWARRESLTRAVG